MKLEIDSNDVDDIAQGWAVRALVALIRERRDLELDHLRCEVERLGRALRRVQEGRNGKV